jgi:hypothetical protein
MKSKLILILLLLGTIGISAQTFTYTGIDLKSEHVKKKNVYEWTNIVLANYAHNFSGSVHSIGVTYARCKLAGYYVNAMLGTEWHFANISGTTDDYFVTNETSHPYFSFGGGGMIRMVIPFYAYLGAGYAYKALNYKTLDGHWVGHVNSWYNPHHCAYLEIGLMGSIKGFTIQVGYTGLMGEQFSQEIKVGLGYAFPDKKKGGAQ